MKELNKQQKKLVQRILVYGMTNNRGGIESYLMSYYRVLAKRGIIFDFVTEHKEMVYKEEAEELGSKIYYIPGRREGLDKHIKAFRKILIENKEYRVVYFNILSASEVFTVLSAAGLKHVTKVVHSHNNSVKTKGRHAILRPLLAALSDIKLACSSEAAEFMFGKISSLKNNVKIINNAVDIEKYAYNEKTRVSTREEWGIIDDQFIIGHVGRICYQKNTLFLIDIFSKIYEKNKNALLMIVGDGEDRKLAENKIKEYGLEKNVLLLGMRSDVEELMQAMDVFVLPSRFEGFGIVLLEAQAAGLPCFTSKDVVPSETNVSGDVQFIDLSEDAEYWSNRILSNSTKDRKDNTNAITMAGYNIQHEAKKLEEILEGINK